ncbi:MAG: DUF1993 domain-containing protein [Alphaproteobacteria bacterium]|nr:DUF1993 domain-containing protein [Alphaproteobacteria bacterium]
MFDTSVPVLVHFLKGLSAILRKAEAHCEARKIDPAALLDARLFPDMFTFTRQVQLTTDFAKGMGARLAGLPVPSFADDEKTFAELQARLDKTIAFLSTLTKEQLSDAAARTVTIKIGGRDTEFAGADYAARYALPNFYFHLTTAYNILRHNGLELGKGDYMGRS